MAAVKRVKSLDISSVTIMATTITLIFAVIISVLGLIALGIISIDYIGVMAFLVPSIICGAIVVSVYRTFIQSFLYNLISKRTSVMISLEDDGTVSKVSTSSTAIVVSIISTVMILIEYMIGLLAIPLILSSAIQTLMMSGAQQIAFELYKLLMMVSNPVFVLGVIVGTFIVTFIYVLIGTYIYNYIASKGYGAEVNIKDNTILESVDVKSVATSAAMIALILGLISGIINAISTGDFFGIIISTVSSFIAWYIGGFILAALYNKLAPKVGKIKFELIDE